MKIKMSPYILLVKLAVESFVKKGKMIEPPKDLPKEFYQKKAGTFVTIEKRLEDSSSGKEKRLLRACIGTYLPTRVNIAQEIIRNATAAAKEDHRFEPVQKQELPSLIYTVYILGEPELVDDISKLDPKRYGVIVNTVPLAYPNKADVVFNGHMPYKVGVLLPDLEDIDTPEKQVSSACQKGGIDYLREKILIYRFTTEKHQ